MLTSSGSTGGGDAKIIISPNTSFGDIIMQTTKVDNMCASDDFTCPVNTQIRMLFPIEFPYSMTNGNVLYNYKILDRACR